MVSLLHERSVCSSYFCLFFAGVYTLDRQTDRYIIIDRQTSTDYRYIFLSLNPPLTLMMALSFHRKHLSDKSIMGSNVHAF